MNAIPIIPETKNYWLIRTQGGKYYKEFRNNGFIGINWEEVTIQDIKEMSRSELIKKIKTNYPEKTGPGRSASQLITFVKYIKQGDTVVITGPSSSIFSIGEVQEDEPYTEIVPDEAFEEGSKICPFAKRKKVKWLKELAKWEMEMKFFKLLQHAQNTISDANDYGDLIEGLVHDFFIKGNNSQLGLRVATEDKIPAHTFFALGNEIIELAMEFNKHSELYQIDVDAISTQINVNSPGKMKFTGPALTMFIVGALVVGTMGGGVSLTTPEELGGISFEMHTNGVLQEVSDFLDARQERQNHELLLKTYMKDLKVDTPEELNVLMKATEHNHDKDASDSSEDK